MVNVNDKSLCCGCSACANVCKLGALKMVYDSEGFLCPEIDEEKCVKCGKCLTVCPIQGKKDKEVAPEYGYIAQHKNLDIRKDSTSGGAFTAIASVILEQGGVIYGATMDEKFYVSHIGASSIDELSLFRNSKYVQSDIRRVYKEISELIEKGILVCFSGTPCQVSAIKNYFGKRAEKLILVDVMCREVISPLVLDKYIECLAMKNNKKLKKLRFRDKHYGYHYSVLKAEFVDGKVYKKSLNYDQYLRAFFSDRYASKSCYSCPYRGVERVGDITIWDAWDIKECSNLLQDDFGATKIIANTDKGEKVMKYALEYMHHDKLCIDKLVGDRSKMYECIIPKEGREDFFTDANNLDGKSLFDKYYPITFKVRFRNNIKNILYKFGIVK